jgi:DNA excision repair protein ERCC-4
MDTIMENDMTIITDSREQYPLSFSVPTVTAKLDTGDYSLAGYENEIAIERKEVNDLVACLKNGNRARFERELERGRELDYFAVVIESSLKRIAEHEYVSDMAPKSVIQSLLAFSVRYRLPVFFSENRKYSARIIESLLIKYVKEVADNEVLQNTA